LATRGGFPAATLAAILSKATLHGRDRRLDHVCHGMRVLSLVDEPAARAIVPSTHAEKERAEGG
jgi:hypothetical protein